MQIKTEHRAKGEESPFSLDCPKLLQRHLDHLQTSGIAEEVIKERGYESVLGKKRLSELSFSRAQQRIPGILIPLYPPGGSPPVYQYRPDDPRLDTKGKPIKYETPANGRIRLDIPPRCVQFLGDPSVDLYITEGAKKADALASHGLCAVNLSGVWGFKGKNDLGGVTFLADWDNVALNSRRVFLGFDSDVMTKPQVQKALERLAEHLRPKGAQVHVLHLPQEGTEKVGVDDYLLTHSVEELLALSKPMESVTEVKCNEVCVPGFIFRDGTIGEMVIDTISGERGFIVSEASGRTVTVSEYPAGGLVYKPMADSLAGRTISFAATMVKYNTFNELLTEVKTFIHKYVELPDNYEIIASLYVLLSWVYDALPTVPYLRALGDPGTGKSRFLEVMGAITFRAIRAAGATTVSPIFRILDRYYGTLILDEADFGRSDEAADIVKILNCGYRSGTPVLRSERTSDKNWEPRSYNVFGPKVIATRRLWSDHALESRCLTWQSEGLTRNDIPMVLGSRFQQESADLRSKLLGFRLDSMLRMMRINLEDVTPDFNFEPRLQEILMPLRAVTQNDVHLDNVLSTVITGMQKELQDTRRNSLEALVLEVILRVHREDGELSAKEIADRLNEEGLIKEHLRRGEKEITARKVAVFLDNLGIKRRLAPGSRRAVVQWDIERIVKLCRRYGLPIPLDNPSHPSPEANILQPDPSSDTGHPSPVLGRVMDGKEGCEGYEGSAREIECQTHMMWEELL